MYDKDGNVDIGFADKTMNWGTLAPVAMIRVAYDKCSKFAGACDGSASKMPTTVVQGDKAFGPSEDGTVTCNYVGNFKGKYKNHMVDALDGAVHKTTEVKHIPDSGTKRSHMKMAWQATNARTGGEGYDQHRHSDKFAVKIPSQGSSILITCTIDISKPDEGDFCSTFFDIAGDVAGAVKGVKGKIAGAAFKLLSLVCNPS